MDNNRNQPSEKLELPTKLKLENTLDTSGSWFAVAVLFAVLAAGLIIYRAANDDIRTASDDALARGSFNFAIMARRAMATIARAVIAVSVMNKYLRGFAQHAIVSTDALG